MKKIKIAAFIIIVAGLVVGFASIGESYTEEVYTVRLRAGETLEGVSEGFYEKNQNGECYDAFRYRVLQRNLALFADGRIPQINDMVMIPVMVKK